MEADVPFDEKGATYKNVQGNIAAGSGGGGLVSNGILQIHYLKSVYIQVYFKYSNHNNDQIQI